MQKYFALKDEWSALKKRRDEAGRTRKDKSASQEQKDEANKFLNDSKKGFRGLEKKVNSRDNEILGLIVDNRSKGIKLVDANLYIQRRYQDDFLNPTGQSFSGHQELRHRRFIR